MKIQKLIKMKKNPNKNKNMNKVKKKKAYRNYKKIKLNNKCQ